MSIIYNRLVKKMTPSWRAGSPNEFSENEKRSYVKVDTRWIVFGFLFVTCIFGLLLRYVYRQRTIIRAQNAIMRTTNQMARSLPTGNSGTRSTSHDRRMSDLRRRMRAFVPAADALKNLREDAAGLREKLEGEREFDSDAVYRRGSWVHHEAPPYNDNDYFFFSCGVASSDPWEFKHKYDHQDKASTHVWWHTPELRLNEMHDKEKERLLRVFSAPDVSTTTSSDARPAGPRRRYIHEIEGKQTSREYKEYKEHVLSSWLRPDPTMFGSIKINPGKTTSALAHIGCVSASCVGGTAMQKVPMEVPLDESKLSTIYARVQESISGQGST